MDEGEGTARPPGEPEPSEASSDIATRAPRLLDQAVGVEWYEQPGNDVDLATYLLCRIRREGGADGDEAVREALSQASPAAVVWLVSRAISYMDESGFPETVERWIPDEETTT
jgi:hypothetical protein